MLIIPLLIKAAVWLGTAAIGAYSVKKVTEVFGSTPINDARKIPGMETMTPKQLFNERKEWRKDKTKYHAEKDEKIQSEIDKLNKKFQLEDEEKTRLSKELDEARKSGDKEAEKRVLAALTKQDEKMLKISKQIKDLEDEKKENGKKRDAIYENFDDNQSQEQVVAKANSINWSSYKNYAIIFIGIVVVIMIIGVIKKLFSSLTSSIKG